MLPERALRQWVLTFPYAWRSRLGRDGELFAKATRLFVRTVLAPLERAAGRGAKSGAVAVIQRTSSDMRLNPHLHVLALDGAYVETAGELSWRPAPHLSTTDVAALLERTIQKLARALRRTAEPEDCALTDSAVTGQAPPAGPAWKRELPPVPTAALRVEKPLCVSKDGFTLHAATHAGGADREGREKLLRYVLRPPIASERVSVVEGGLVRLTLKRAYSDGTVAVEMDPLSFVCRLAAAVPPPRRHLVTYAGVPAPASKWRSRIAPPPPVEEVTAAGDAAAEGDAASARGDDERAKRGGPKRTWAELLARTFRVDVLECPDCGGRMRLLAVVTKAESVRRYLERLGEPADPPAHAPSRGPPYWKSTVLRRKSGDVSAA